MSVENYELIQKLALEDVSVLKVKGQHYGRSWIKRGGVGAFMMLARKWDRIENDAEKQGFDILAALRSSKAAGKDLLDDIADIRRYLLLVEAEFRDGAQENEIGPIDERHGTAVGQLKI